MLSVRSALHFAVLAVLASLSMGSLHSGNQAAEERPPILGIAWVTFRVSSLEEARHFYGGLLGYEEAVQIRDGDGLLQSTFFKVSDRQFIEIVPDLPAGEDERLVRVALETPDVEAMRRFLQSQGISVPDETEKGPDGNPSFHVLDPEGHGIAFVQFSEESLTSQTRGRFLPDSRVSGRILHVGLTVRNVETADRFYREVLAFSEIWRGGMTDTETRWINMKIPEGTDYIEYMLIQEPPDRRLLGVLHHVALQVPDIQDALDRLRERPLGGDSRFIRPPQVGRNNRWQLNLYDHDGTRAELMEPFTIR